MKISLVIPTRNRPETLQETLNRLSRLDPMDLGSCELLIVDNCSDKPDSLPKYLPNGIEVSCIRLDSNMHSAARNIAAQQARGHWLVMLDDDSSLCPCPLAETLDRLPLDVAAVGGEIWLNRDQRESGGLPEVIIGCGCAIRRDVFLSVDGYDPTFGYYAEEYDLCAKLILAGYRVLQTRSLQFEHRKVTAGRDFNEIMFRLVRNNGWVLERYAPEFDRDTQVTAMLERYRMIAINEEAQEGYERGRAMLMETREQQVRAPLDAGQWERFTGRAAVRVGLEKHIASGGEYVQLVGPGFAKGREIVESELFGLGCEIGQSQRARAVVGSISPGPMLDLQRLHPEAILPWFFGPIGQTESSLHTIP